MTSSDHNYENQLMLYHDDGLLDIFVGLAVLFASQFIRTDNIGLAAIFIPIMLPIWKAARDRFVARRINQLGKETRMQVGKSVVPARLSLLFGGLVLLGMGTSFFLGLISNTGLSFLYRYFLVFLGCLFAVIWGYTAIILKKPRFILHASFTLASLAISQISLISFWEALALIGILSTCVGLITFIRFLREHPIHT